MGGDGSLDEKLASHVFVTDFVWAARAIFAQPSVALVSIAFWVLPLFAPHVGHSWAVAAGMVLFIPFMLGWLGAERMFFLRRREGTSVTVRELLGSVRFFAGRFFRLGLLLAIVVIPLILVIARFARYLEFTAPFAPHARIVATIQAVTVLIPVDVLLTFVPSALVYTTRDPRQALRIGFSMIRRTWPRSALYVLCPPLALNLLNTIYPTDMLIVSVVTTAGLALLALIAKGATAAFYLRAGTLSADAFTDTGLEPQT
ncbi:MAG TPA: hypothetical protein VN903_33030 [Polyangia bacterium]|jgi:hypothetical protein|nr:hypothetical protein [Polyangia bacterium]